MIQSVAVHSRRSPETREANTRLLSATQTRVDLNWLKGERHPGESRMCWVQDIVIPGDRHRCRWNSEDGLLAAVDPHRSLLSSHIFGYNIRPTFRNVGDADFNIIRCISIFMQT